MMTICDAQYQTPVIFTLTPSTIWAITVTIAITGYELCNSADNSAIQPPIQAVHPTVFQFPCFNNRPNSPITQFHPPKKQTLLWFLLHSVDRGDAPPAEEQFQSQMRLLIQCCEHTAGSQLCSICYNSQNKDLHLAISSYPLFKVLLQWFFWA